MKTLLKHSRGQDGFTLLELLLTLGISAMLFVGISQITRSWINNEVADNAGQQMQEINGIVEKYVRTKWNAGTGTPLNESADIIADALANGPSSPWHGLLRELQQANLITTGNELRSSLGPRLNIAYTIDNSDPAEPIYRTAVFTTKTLPNQTVTNAARYTGANGGTITAFPSTADAVGIFGQWTVPVASLIPAGGGVFPCVASQTEGCLVALTTYDNATLCGPFLYRNATTDCVDGTTMQTPLNMNGQNIINANNIETDNLMVNQVADLGTTNVSGPATFNGVTTMQQRLSANNGVNVIGDTNVTGNLSATSGTVNAGQINATTIEAPVVNATNLNAQNLAVNNGDLTVSGNMNVNGNINSGSEVVAGTINAATINAGNGPMTVGSMNVNGPMTISGTVDMSSTTINATQLIADDCVKIRSGPGTYTNYGPNCPP